jgi:hypothetical protein
MNTGSVDKGFEAKISPLHFGPAKNSLQHAVSPFKMEAKICQAVLGMRSRGSVYHQYDSDAVRSDVNREIRVTQRHEERHDDI